MYLECGNWAKKMEGGALGCRIFYRWCRISYSLDRKSDQIQAASLMTAGIKHAEHDRVTRMEQAKDI